jgi:large subunit ribosomal protein L21
MARYAIIQAAGKQHRVEPGDVLTLDHTAGDVGSTLQIDQVLLLGGEEGLKVGRPMVAGAHVTAKIVAHLRGDKIRVFKRRKRKGFHKTIGHRQALTELEITAIAE